MKEDEVWVKQRKEKYANHDFSLDDLKPMDLEILRDRAVNAFTRTNANDNVKIIIDVFMSHLTHKGFRIMKK